MDIILIIYLIGVVASAAMGIYIAYKDEDIEYVDILCIMIYSVCSWISIAAMGLCLIIDYICLKYWHK